MQILWEALKGAVQILQYSPIDGFLNATRSNFLEKFLMNIILFKGYGPAIVLWTFFYIIGRLMK
jgi:hypothetical protein